MEERKEVKAIKIKLVIESDKEYPKKLKQIKNPPKKLYVLGDMTLLQKPSIAIVGSRDATSYGKKYAAEFARRISSSNITVVSGLAMGIDCVAHENAINEEGKTIAVLGSGFNYIFPKENIPLLEKIVKKGGCIISEYEPNTKSNLKNFPFRNRIIAGLSMAVLVVEAKYRSGSSVTARHAFAQQKEVFCIPHQIEDKNGVGINRLLQKGAKVVTKIEDIQRYMKIDIKEEIVEKKEKTEIRNRKKELEKMLAFEEREIEKEYCDIYRLLKKQSMNVNQLSQKLRKPVSELNQSLTIMEIRGYIKAVPGNEFIIKEG